MMAKEINWIFVDVGGVLLTNGWDRQSRQKAAELFNIDYKEMDDRHHIAFDSYETGKITLDDYLKMTVFYQPRSFSPEDFKNFMFDQSKAHPEMIELIKEFKQKHALKIVVVSNEGRELTLHRIRAFQLDTFVDSFISSCFAHLKKPDHQIYRLALDTSQADPEQVIYIDDRSLFVEVGAQLGMQAVHHTSYESTRKALTEIFSRT